LQQELNPAQLNNNVVVLPEINNQDIDGAPAPQPDAVNPLDAEGQN